MRVLDRLQPLALVVMRLALGGIMLVHGYHKVFGGLHHHADLVAGLGLPGWLGYVSSFTEFLGGLLILAGFFTRIAAFAVFLDLAVAIWKVHLHNGLIGSPDRPGSELALAASAYSLRPDLLRRGPHCDRSRPPRRGRQRVKTILIRVESNPTATYCAGKGSDLGGCVPGCNCGRRGRSGYPLGFARLESPPC